MSSLTKAKPKSRQQAPQELLQGAISRISFRNKENGFSVMRVELASSNGADKTCTLVGVLPAGVDVGSFIIARGSWQSHQRFGQQFRAYSISETNPSGRSAILRYLSSGAINGFGPVLAERVVQAFGEQTVEVLDNTPERLLEVPGVGPKKFAEIKESWQANQKKRDILLFFHNHEVPGWLAERIIARYSTRAIEVVKSNPYVLAREMVGVGFLTADRLAMALGIEKSSPERLRAGISYCLHKALDDGHCYLPKEELLSLADKLLDVEETYLLESALNAAIQAAEVIAEEEAIFLPNIYRAEQALAHALSMKLAVPPADLPYVPEQFELELVQGAIEMPQANGPSKTIELSTEQAEAVHLARTQSLLVITGGPGCGKTTIVRTITKLFSLANLRIALTAPTGRAAQRLAEVCGLKAQTIHRLLKFDPITRGFTHDQDNPLPYDVIVADESSMIDVQLAASLLAAISPNTRLIIVGDADQLPSVGPGLFLADLLSSPLVPRVRLNKLFRREDESIISKIAYDINHAQIPDIPQPDGQTKSDAYFLPVSSPAEAQDLLERLVIDQIPKRFGFKGADITVLSPMNKGELGVIALNERLQKALRPLKEEDAGIKVGNLVYAPGDRICQRVNNYNLGETGVFNGDQGEVVAVDSQNRNLSVRLWDGREVTYSGESLEQLDLAYALSIHRSQGSEVPVVVLVLHDSHYIMLERQLFYTAVTRAKKLLIVVGTLKAISKATLNSRSQKRYTSLAKRIRTIYTVLS